MKAIGSDWGAQERPPRGMLAPHLNNTQTGEESAIYKGSVAQENLANRT